MNLFASASVLEVPLQDFSASGCYKGVVRGLIQASPDRHSKVLRFRLWPRTFQQRLAPPPRGAFFKRSVASLPLCDAEFLGVAIKHKLLPCNKPYLQYGSHAFKFGPRNAINESVTFRHRDPHGREVISPSHQFGTKQR